MAGMPVSQAGLPASEAGMFDRLHTAASGICTPVGPGEPGPVSSREPPVMKKQGMLVEGQTRLPVSISQLVTSWLMW